MTQNEGSPVTYTSEADLPTVTDGMLRDAL